MYSIDIMEKGCEYLLKLVSLDGLKKYHTKVKELLNGKANSSHKHTKSQISDFPSIISSITSGSSSLATSGAIYTALQSHASKEIGTWTPSSSSNTDWEFRGYYSKIGNFVIIWCAGYDTHDVGSITISQNYPITGLPYASNYAYSYPNLAYAGFAKAGGGYIEGDLVIDGYGRSNLYPYTKLTCSSYKSFQILGWYLTDS